MPDALLCKQCWSATTDDSFRKTYPLGNSIEPGPESCDLCRLVAKSIIAFRKIGHRPDLQRVDWGPARQKFALYHPSRYPRCGVNVTYTLPVTKEAEDGGGVGAGREQVEAKAIGRAELEITTPLHEDLPWTGFANANEISNHSGSEGCFVRIMEWLGECLSNHQNCNKVFFKGANAESPKRLIDTGSLDDDPVPRLIECADGDNERLKYCALSYCWGGRGEENYMTTGETYQTRRSGITFEELPEMFRDAVVIARRVGCRYLWIDSICIIQHDRLDWESEAPCMHSIYGNAYLVIAATFSPSPSSGIFTTRPPTAHFDFDCVGKTYKISVKERVDHDIWITREHNGFQTFPLHSRAWAFQERLLARRVIHYSPSELVWECNTHIRCECSGIEWPRIYTSYNAGASLKSEVVGALAVGALALAEAAKHGEGAWRSIVSQYTARQLTIQNDRLPALSGLARQFAFPQVGEYFAGIWYSQLPDALDWTIKNPRKPDGYRAPFWSWASLDGPVNYFAHGDAKEVDFIEAGCTLVSENPYGEVSDGYIVVKGEFGPSNRWSHSDEDYDYPVNDDEEIWALKLNFSDWNIWHSLLLKRSRRVKEAWERIGLGIESDGCFEEGEKSIIRIV